MLLTEIRRNQKLAAKRNPMYDRNRFAKFLIYLFTAFWAAYLILIGVTLPIAFEEGFPTMEPYDVLNACLSGFLFIDFLLRFLFPTPTQQIKPYLLLPIKKQQLINVLLVQVGLKAFNLFWLFFFVPFAAMTVVRFYGVIGVVCYALGIWLLMVANAYWSVLVRTLQRRHIAWVLLPIGCYALMAIGGFFYSYVSDFSMALGETLIQGKILAYLGILVVIALLAFLNSRVQMACIYSELNRREKMPQVKHAGRYRFLNRFGLTGEYMKLELKMIFRNKAPRKNFQMMTVIIVLFALALFGMSHTEEATWFTLYLYSIYCFTGYAISILSRIMAYEGAYLDGLMMHRDSLLHLFRAKYYVYCLLLLIPLICLLPSVIWSNCSVSMLVSQLVYTAGVTFPVIMLLALVNRKTAPLDASLMGKGQWNSPFQMLAVACAFFVPMALCRILLLWMEPSTTYLVCTLLGVPGIVLHPLWCKLLYRKVFQKRHSLMEDLRKTR